MVHMGHWSVGKLAQINSKKKSPAQKRFRLQRYKASECVLGSKCCSCSEVITTVPRSELQEVDLGDYISANTLWF